MNHVCVLTFIGNRSMAQLGSASALGAEGRRFESCYSDCFSWMKNKNGIDQSGSLLPNANTAVSDQFFT